MIINNDMEAPPDPLESNLVLLFQKEVLLDEILTILNEEDIDLNNLLGITLERIEANFYEPPDDLSLQDGLSLDLEDKLKMPPSKAKWKKANVMNSLKLDLTNIDANEGSEKLKDEIQKSIKRSGKNPKGGKLFKQDALPKNSKQDNKRSNNLVSDDNNFEEQIGNQHEYYQKIDYEDDEYGDEEEEMMIKENFLNLDNSEDDYGLQNKNIRLIQDSNTGPIENWSV